MRTLLLPLGLSVLVGVAATAACSGSVTLTSFSWPSDLVPTGACTSGDAILVSMDECNCGGPSYAICSGTTWSECACSLPSGDTLISFDSGPGDSGSPDAPGPDAMGGDSSPDSMTGSDANGDGQTGGDGGTDSGGDTGGDGGGTDGGSGGDAAGGG